MAQLKTIEKRYFENLFEMDSGYVLDFSNQSFAQLINDTVNINIYDDKYQVIGNSKAKRLRSFWEIESDIVVGKVLEEMLAVWKFEQLKNSKPAENEFYIECKKIVNRLLSKTSFEENIEESFLRKEFDEINLSLLGLDLHFENIINQRLEEINQCLKNDSTLSVIFLCGSTLEGLLLEKASKHIKEFNTASSAPKNKDKKVKRLEEWSLSNLIDTAYEVGYIELDIKRFSHDLRNFRNYIHPRVQAMQSFTPDSHTAEISWKVLQVSIASLSGLRM